jgi:hypothetical protein
VLLQKGRTAYNFEIVKRVVAVEPKSSVRPISSPNKEEAMEQRKGDFEKFLRAFNTSQQTRIKFKELITLYEKDHKKLSYNAYKHIIRKCMFYLRHKFVYFQLKRNLASSDNNTLNIILNRLKAAKQADLELIAEFFKSNKIPFICNVCDCSDDGVIEIHHIDMDRKNNRVENLSLLCANCHVKLHKNLLTPAQLDRLPLNTTKKMQQANCRKPAPAPSSQCVVEQPPPSVRVPLELPQLELGKMHKLLLIVPYTGQQPHSERASHYGKNRENVGYLFETENGVIIAHKHKIQVWLRGITGDTSKEMLERATGRARVVAGAFAKAHSINLDWKNVVAYDKIHINFTEEHEMVDNLVYNIVKQEPGRAETELGILAGDHSHPDQTEFVGDKGKMSFDALSFAIKQLPVLAVRIGEYNDNIKLHLDTLKEIKDAIKELKDIMKR